MDFLNQANHHLHNLMHINDELICFWCVCAEVINRIAQLHQLVLEPTSLYCVPKSFDDEVCICWREDVAPLVVHIFPHLLSVVLATRRHSQDLPVRLPCIVSVIGMLAQVHGGGRIFLVESVVPISEPSPDRVWSLFVQDGASWQTCSQRQAQWLVLRQLFIIKRRDSIIESRSKCAERQCCEWVSRIVWFHKPCFATAASVQPMLPYRLHHLFLNLCI